MKAKATPSNTGKPVIAVSQHAAGRYEKVLDQRKRRVRGLWKRNGTFYAQLTIPDPMTGDKTVRRVRMEDKDGNPVPTLAEAIKVMNRLKVKREDQTLNLDPKRTPTFAEYWPGYIERLRALKDAKRPQTIRREETSCGMLSEYIGGLRLRQITPAVINTYMVKRRAKGVSARSINLDVITLRNVLKAAIEDGHLSSIPTVKRLKETKTERKLVTFDEIERVATVASKAPITGQMVADFIRLMSYSGGRWGETLRLRWKDVDFDRKQITFGADGLSKNGRCRAVDFNPKLAAHLKDMEGRKAPDSECLFPSRRRSEDKDLPMLSFNMTLRQARVKAKVPNFSCHACRHFFASMCLMSGVDLHTVASWLGHQDNGVLLAKTYSHLLNEHKAEQAKQVNFGPVEVESQEAAQ